MPHRLASIALLLFSILCINTFPAAQEESTDIKVKVELTTIDVFALDKHGEPVPNLKKEDFELYEDGKKQEIATFDDVTEKASNSALGVSPLDDTDQVRGKTVLIIFDDSSIRMDTIQSTRDSAMNFVQKHMQPQDRFAVAVYAGEMKMLQNLTNDRDDILAAIEQSANTIKAQMYFPDFLISLKSMTDSLARLKGRKTFILYTSPGPEYVCSGCEKTYKEALDSAQQSNVVFNIISVAREQAAPNPSFEKATHEQAVMPHLDSSGKAALSRVPSQSTADKAAKAAAAADPNAHGRGSMSITSFVEGSGGSHEGLESLGLKISNYYILGYQSANPRRDGSFRKIEVKAKEKGIKLQHQAGYVDRRPVDLLGAAIQDQPLLTALVSSKIEQKVALAFHPAYFYVSKNLAQVLIEARIAAVNIAFGAKEKMYGTDLKVIGIAYAENGRIAARFSEIRPLRFNSNIKEAAEFQKAKLAYRAFFKLHPGKYRIKLAVSDEANDLGIAEESLEIPALKEKEVGASSLILAERASKVSETTQQLKAQLLGENNPLLFGETQVEPSVGYKVTINGAVPILFRLYNVPGAPEQWDLKAKATLINEKEARIPLDQFSLKNLISPAENGQGVALANIPMKNAPVGKYKLKIDIFNSASTQLASLQTDLEVIQ